MQMTKKTIAPQLSKLAVLAMWKLMDLYIANLEVTSDSSLTTWRDAGIRRGPLTAACVAMRRS